MAMSAKETSDWKLLNEHSRDRGFAMNPNTKNSDGKFLFIPNHGLHALFILYLHLNFFFCVFSVFLFIQKHGLGYTLPTF